LRAGKDWKPKSENPSKTMDPELEILEASEKMDKALQHTGHEFNTLHTGKASPAMVENIQVHVESYGSSMHLRELAAITTPDPRLIQIQAWDKSVVRDIEKAIQTANLGLNPAVAGEVIRVPVPELSGERRQELVRVAHNIAEEGRISIRHARRDALAALRKMKKDSDISEDNMHRCEKEVQDATDLHIKKIGEHLEQKEIELTTV